MNALKTSLRKFYCDESGAAAIEYGLLVALLALALIGALTTLGENTSDGFDNFSEQLKTAQGDASAPS